MIIALDGDTVSEHGQVYRLVGFNAPEARALCPREAQLAALARLRIEKAVRGGAILIRVPCARSSLDRYGRACARMIFQGVDIADLMIAEGLAEPYVCGPWGCPKRRNWCND